MKKTRFWLAVCLIVTVFTFTGCGNQDDKNRDEVPDNKQNESVQQDMDDAADETRDDAEDLGDDIRDDIDDASDDVKDAMDGDDKKDDTDKKDNADKNQNDVKQ